MVSDETKDARHYKLRDIAQSTILFHENSHRNVVSRYAVGLIKKKLTEASNSRYCQLAASTYLPEFQYFILFF